ncbi:MAG: hypothetical protein ABL888_16345, partial [Pirellulaceae bacterium]
MKEKQDTTKSLENTALYVSVPQRQLDDALDAALSNAFRAAPEVRSPSADDDKGKILGDKYE